MDKIWIKEYGKISAQEIRSVVRRLMPSEAAGIAYYTDRFAGADQDHVMELCEDVQHLLELRLFGKDSELRFYRSHIGSDFSWRLADDNVLKAAAEKETDPFLKNPEHHMTEYRQYLDCDSTYPSSLDPMGCRKIRSTGGGYYAVPAAEKQDMVRIKAYLQYDQNGVVHIADYRIAGFCCEEGEG